jgi:hypothetical protein
VLLTPCLSTHHLLLNKGEVEFENIEYLHAHVLNRTVQVLEKLLKHRNKEHSPSEIGNANDEDENVPRNCEENSVESSSTLQERSLHLLNLDLFFLLLLVMIKENTLSQVRDRGRGRCSAIGDMLPVYFDHISYVSRFRL